MFEDRARGMATAGAAAALLAVAVTAMGACAGTTRNASDDDGSPAATSGSGADGGAGGSGGSPSACPIDCATIAAPACQRAQCNPDTAQCEILPVPDGETCDDGLFCTVDDRCVAGSCEGGGQNDCGMTPQACQEIVCDETTDSCSQEAQPPGASCQDPNNLCITGGTCQNGLCLGGSPNDCFFFPVSDDCHVAQCNPANGMCEEVVGNEGLGCTDLNDLCTVNKTCVAGVCQGGNPKDCSQLTQGCNIGVCDIATGQCQPMAVMNNDPCDDLNPCTTGETCSNGQCIGGTAITTCINGDGCCAPGCTDTNDTDCACNPGDPIVNGKCSLTTVCGKAAPDMFCGGNCSSNTAQFADWWCQLGGYSSAYSYTELTSGVVSCLYYNGQTNPLTSCSQVLGPTSYGLATFCTAADNILCNP